MHTGTPTIVGMELPNSKDMCVQGYILKRWTVRTLLIKVVTFEPRPDGAEVASHPGIKNLQYLLGMSQEPKGGQARECS